MCDRIYGKKIQPGTWYTWEKLARVNQPQGRKRCNRVYKTEQWQILIAIAYFRALFPKNKLTSNTIRDYYAANKYKIEEELDKACSPDYKAPKEPEKPKMMQLAKVKTVCDRIMNGEIDSQCWARWKRHIGISAYNRYCQESQAAILTYIATWRKDNHNLPLPSVNKLLMLMEREWRGRTNAIETAVSSHEFNHWRKYGCKGHDLIRYLGKCGFRVGEYSLYRWGGYKRKKYYNPAELLEWEKTAKAKSKYSRF